MIAALRRQFRLRRLHREADRLRADLQGAIDRLIAGRPWPRRKIDHLTPYPPSPFMERGPGGEVGRPRP